MGRIVHLGNGLKGMVGFDFDLLTAGNLRLNLFFLVLLNESCFLMFHGWN